METVANYMEKGGHGVPWSLIRDEDDETPIAVQRARHLLVREGATREELTRLIDWYYGKMRDEVLASSAPNKKVFIYLYPTDARAKAGLGDWIAMASAVGESDLPDAALPRFKLPKAGARQPSANDDKIYNDLMAEFAKSPPMDDRDEGKIMRRVAKRHGISVKALEDIHLRVMVARQGG